MDYLLALMFFDKPKINKGVIKMKITIEADSKEIADLVLAVQDKLKMLELSSPKDLLTNSINSVLHEKSHDTIEGKSY